MSASVPQRTFTYKECGRTPPGNNSYSIILSNDVASNVVVVISIAFFAKGFGNNGWCILSDTSPKEILGVSGEVFNSSGNIACIVTPLCIGYIPAVNLAILDVGAMGILSGVSYLPVIVSLKRLQIDPPYRRKRRNRIRL